MIFSLPGIYRAVGTVEKIKMKNIERRLVLYIKNSQLLCFLFLSAAVNAATVDITTEYKLDPYNPGNIAFKNTTPISGYCVDFPNMCPGIFSIEASRVEIEKHFKSDSQLPEHTYTFKIDSRPRQVLLTSSDTGNQISASFTVTDFGTWLETSLVDHSMVAFDTSLATCKIAGEHFYNPHWYFMAWQLPKNSNTVCHIPFPTGASVDNEWRYRRTGFAYDLRVDSPLTIPTGVYEGEVVYTIGRGGDIDFFTDAHNDNEMRFRITATVEHAFRMQFPSGSNRIQLEPTGGWGQWLNSGRMPAKMERNVDFSLTTSGPISIALQCEQEMGTNCALRNQNTGEKVELETRVTLPGLKPLGGGAEVRDYRLATGPIKQFFIPEAYSYKRQSTVHFRVNQPHVETMLKQPGSQWAGNVTLMFEAGL